MNQRKQKDTYSALGVAIINDKAEIINVETKISKGTGLIEITGCFSDDIVTSIKNSIIYLKKTKDLTVLNININIRGNIPLSGFSLGLAIYHSISFALNNKSVDNVVFTGNINSSGVILPVGGMRLKEACANEAGKELCTNFLK